MPYTQLPWRESDQKVFVADINKVKRVVNWKPNIVANEGINRMLDWLQL